MAARTSVRFPKSGLSVCVIIISVLWAFLTESVDKEVEGYYEDGLRVPDDVTLLWADDK